ncbi:branched-chain amino acid ABC transporter permease [Massilia terrae]|uniref:ABC transporter ATP-binding protein n=1 Tax=Massilia terrae TaxID=1811224 RepID=A0ABT2CWQ5_9BURK|nr:ABC transporter ATP-binding protein [Massilia terrae]MCS0658225.1 ABC transporter ATP-binding protein [Massilia terrae]
MAFLSFDVRHKPRQSFASIALLLAVMIAFPFFASHYGNSWVRILDMALLYIMLALGLNIVVGFAGLLDLGYIAFFAVGAYLTGVLSSPQFAALLQSVVDNYPALGEWLVKLCGPEVAQNGIHLSVWIIVPLAALVAGMFGALLGAPTLKLRGDYLAIVTLGFGEIIRIFMNNLNDPINFTNGPQGINMIDPVRIGGVSLAGEPGSGATVHVFGLSMPSVNAYYFLFLLLCGVTIFITSRLQHSRLGRAWVAIREDEVAAKAMGINTRNVKLLAFSMGASFGGVAGAMFGAFQGFVSPESFSFTESIAVLAMVVLGGIGHIPGVVMGGVLLAALPEVLRHVVEPAQMALFGHVIIEAEVLRQLLYGLAMVLIMLNRPAGLWPSPNKEERPMAASDTDEAEAAA